MRIEHLTLTERLYEFRYRSLLLLAALVLQFPLMPLRGSVSMPGTMVSVTLVSALVLLFLARRPRRLVTGACIAAPALLVSYLGEVNGRDSQALIPGLVLSVAFLGYGTWFVLRELFTRDVTMDTITNSANGFLLLGLIWKMVYAIIEFAQPGSFRIDSSLTPEQIGQALMYFSYVTLTTLGFGDIVPLSPWARAMASLQAVVGQLYLAVVVARLVGIYIAQNFMPKPGSQGGSA